MDRAAWAREGATACLRGEYEMKRLLIAVAVSSVFALGACKKQENPEETQRDVAKAQAEAKKDVAEEQAKLEKKRAEAQEDIAKEQRKGDAEDVAKEQKDLQKVEAKGE